MKSKRANAPKTKKVTKKKERYPMRGTPSVIAKNDQTIQAEAARILGVSRERVSQLIKTGKLKFTLAQTPRGTEKYVSRRQCEQIVKSKT